MIYLPKLGAWLSNYKHVNLQGVITDPFSHLPSAEKKTLMIDDNGKTITTDYNYESTPKWITVHTTDIKWSC